LDNDIPDVMAGFILTRAKRESKREGRALAVGQWL